MSANTVSRGIWSKFTSRPSTLSVKNPLLKTALLSPDLPNGPVSLKSGASKGKYYSPVGLNKIYPMAYKQLEDRSELIYKQIDEINEKINNSNNENDKLNLINEKESLLIKAEEDNPEVLYNSLFSLNSVDRSQPVYRNYLLKNWKKYNRMLIMQRLETLSIIPDTLPTLDPKVEIKLKFPNNNVDTWIEPGSILSSNVTSKPPSLEIIEFKESIDNLYTILIVNPDTPDIENDSFKTTLHYGLKNVKLSNNDSIIDIKKLDSNPDYTLINYLPPVPEKNLGNQRFAVWVFSQNNELNLSNNEINRDNFNIRDFVSKNNLNPIGAHVWRSCWDLNTENVRKLYGLPAGRIFSRDRL